MYYIFGSEDSIDIDVIIPYKEIPNIQECKEICLKYKKEFGFSANIVVIEDGFITNTYKGSVDETNNSVFITFDLHKQKYYPNPIKGLLKRDVELKVKTATRKILSFISRTSYRNYVKRALNNNDFSEKIKALEIINFNKLPIGNEKNELSLDTLKGIAFQLSQTLALINGKELYTKKSLVLEYPELEPLIYRKENIPIDILNNYKSLFIEVVRKIL
ncbi:MAG: hypothetical protein U0354_03425 [Candidatus Sericytochromatia bacterium]